MNIALRFRVRAPPCRVWERPSSLPLPISLLSLLLSLLLLPPPSLLLSPRLLERPYGRCPPTLKDDDGDNDYNDDDDGGGVA